MLLRWDHLQAGERGATALQRAFRVHVCPWRPRWIPGTTGNGRWSSAWVTWLRGYRGPPATHWVKWPADHMHRIDTQDARI
jgi:hypothetical protein